MSKIPISTDETFEREFQRLRKEYPYDMVKITGIQPKQLDFVGYIKNFCEANNIADSSVDGTSNVTAKDVVGLENDISKPILKLVAYSKIYTKLNEKYGENTANDWLESEFLGAAYLHDAHSSTLIPYCYAYDITKLATEGLFFLNYTNSVPYDNKPAKHLDTFVNHIKEYVSFCSNRQAGAVGLPNLLPWMFYFWLKDIENNYNGCSEEFGIGIEGDNQNIKYFRQCTQSLIYALNQPYLRNSVQSAFTNVSIFDHNYAHSLFDGLVYPDGKLAFDYIDNIVELQMLFMSVVADIRKESMFTFPVLTISLLTEVDENGNFVKFADEEFAKWASDHNTQWFDSNFFLDDKVTSLSNCCRLVSDISDSLNENGYFNSIGGSGLSVGSVKVNTVNLAHIAYDIFNDENNSIKLDDDKSIKEIIKTYLEQVENQYIEKLKRQVVINLKCLDVIRDVITTNKEKRHLLPNISDGLIDMKHMYNTVGIIGVYETIKTYQNQLDKIKEALNFVDFDEDYQYIYIDEFGNTFYKKRAEQFVKRIFNEGIHQTFKEFKEKYNIKYSINCEQIPGETAAKKLMQKDELLYNGLVVNDLPLYGNQFIPLGIKTTLEERVRVAALFDSFLNGGSICHINYVSTMNKEQAWKALNWIAEQGLTYSAFTTKISACKYNHAFFGHTCPYCGNDAVTTYARIVGFYTPTGIDDKGKETGVGSWSSARKEEFKLRQWEA